VRGIVVWILIVLLAGFSVWSPVGISLIKEGRGMDNVAPEILLVLGIAATPFGSLLCISAAVIPLARARGWFGGRRQRSRIAPRARLRGGGDTPETQLARSV
jgi:hypothetical protein